MVTKYSVVLLLFAMADAAGAAAEKAVVFSSKEDACNQKHMYAAQIKGRKLRRLLRPQLDNATFAASWVEQYHDDHLKPD